MVNSRPFTRRVVWPLRYGVFPWTRNHLLWAILKCEADNVAFVDQGGETKPQNSYLDRLKHLLQQREPDFIDFGSLEQKLELTSIYINRLNGQEEILLKNEFFERLVGKKQQADQLKVLLAEKGFLQTETGNNGKRRYVVRRGKGGKRDLFVSIDLRIKAE